MSIALGLSPGTGPTFAATKRSALSSAADAFAASLRDRLTRARASPKTSALTADLEFLTEAFPLPRSVLT